MTKPRRFLLPTIGFALCLFVYGYFFGWGTLFALQAHWMARRAPLEWVLPTALTDVSMDGRPAQTRNALGYSFEVPLDDVDESQTKLTDHILLLKSRTHQWTLAVLAGGPKRLVQEVTSSDGHNGKLSTAFYGDALQSDYLLHRRIYELTPSQITPFTPRRVAGPNSALLLMKGIMLPAAAQSGLYEISSGTLKGFQYGNPSVSTRLNVELFDDAGEISFLIGQEAENEKMPVTQAQINRIVQSVRRVGTADAVR